MIDFCRITLRTLGAALIIGLGFFSGAFAQSGNPIRIGMSLALTGAGASPSKVVNTALDLWRDDINARGGLLGRPVEHAFMPPFARGHSDDELAAVANFVNGFFGNGTAKVTTADIDKARKALP